MLIAATSQVYRVFSQLRGAVGFLPLRVLCPDETWSL